MEHPVRIPSRIAGVTRLYILCSLSRIPTKRSRGSTVLILPLQAGHRSDFVLSRSCSAIHRSMQSSCASSVQGQAFTQTALGTSVGFCRQMKQLRRLGSVWARWSSGLGVEVVVVAGAGVGDEGFKVAATASFGSDGMVARCCSQGECTGGVRPFKDLMSSSVLQLGCPDVLVQLSSSDLAAADFLDQTSAVPQQTGKFGFAEAASKCWLGGRVLIVAWKGSQ